MTVILIVFLVILSFLLANPVITVLHELGHACAYLILTKPSKVDVYIGSYGDKASKINFRLGKLYFHVKVTMLKGGMCQASEPETNYKKQLIILFAGTIFSFLTICIFGFFILDSEAHGALKLYFFGLIIWSAHSLYANLIPRAINPTLDSDGKQIRFILRVKSRYRDYIDALYDFNRGQYELASQKFIMVTDRAPFESKILRLLITSLIQIKNFEAAEKYLIQLEGFTELRINELLHYGYILSVAGRCAEAINIYNKVLEKDENNLIALNNIGYELAIKNKYETASSYLKKAIELNPDFASPYSILGYLELINGNLELGKQLVDRSLQMDPNYAYSYKHLAVYYLKIGDKENATLNLEKAARLDSLIDLKPLLIELAS